MDKIQQFGKDPITERNMFFLSINGLNEIPRDIVLPGPNFVCFIAWNSSKATVDEISSVVEPLIKSGCSYFCTWGLDCERVHDIIDGIDSYPYNDLGSPEDSVIMSSWHENETLEEALYFFLNTTWPDEHYENTTSSSLAVVIGNQEWSESIKNALSEPRKFSTKYLNNDR